MRWMLLALPLAACTPDVPTPAKDLAWLVGSWRTDDLRTETVESWEVGPSGDLMGQSRVKLHTDAGDAIGFAETLLIADDPGGRTYVAWPVDQQPTRFKVVEITPTSMTVENGGQAFPRKLVYTRVGEILDVVASGTKDGQPYEESYKLTHVATSQ
jgi:hypothetical protein